MPDYLWGGCSLSVQYGEGREAVGGFYQGLIWLQLRLSFSEKEKKKKFSIQSAVAGFN